MLRNLGPELRRTVNGREVKHEDPVLALLSRVQLQVQEHHEVFERGHRLPAVLRVADEHLRTREVLQTVPGVSQCVWMTHRKDPR